MALKGSAAEYLAEIQHLENSLMSTRPTAGDESISDMTARLAEYRTRHTTVTTNINAKIAALGIDDRLLGIYTRTGTNIDLVAYG